MSLRRALFTEADVRRARKAAPDCTVEITSDGTIRIVPSVKLENIQECLRRNENARKRDVRF